MSTNKPIVISLSVAIACLIVIVGGIVTMFVTGFFGLYDLLIDPITPAMAPLPKRIVSFSINTPKENSINYGFIDTRGKMVIPASFKDASNFHEGLCAVRLDKTWGFINKTGNLVIPANFDRVSDFSEGLAAARQGRQWGYIDTAGNWVIKPRWRTADEFHNGVAIVSEGAVKRRTEDDTYQFTYRETCAIVDKTGNFVLPPSKLSIDVESNGMRRFRDAQDQWGFVDSHGKLITKTTGSDVHGAFPDAFPFSDDLAAVSDEQSGRWGFINKRGEMVIKPKFDSVECFRNGLATATLNGKVGLIDKTGEFVLQPKFDHLMAAHIGSGAGVAHYSSQGLMPIASDAHWGFADSKTGKIAIKPNYLDVDPFTEGLARVGL